MILVRLLSCVMCLLLAGPTLAAPGTDSDPAYYRDSERGWHWYEVRPEPPATPPTAVAPPAGGGAGQGAAPLSAAWLRKQLPRYRDLALDAPTPENVELYYLLQRLSVDKAERFADAHGQMIARNAFLDESNERPQTAMGKSALRATRNSERAEAFATLQSLGVGAWYFFRSDCPYCHKFTPVLEILQQLYGLRILPISLDGAPLQDGSFPDYVVDEGQGAQLQVRVTPTLFLVKPPERRVQLTTGLRTLDELEDRILLIARDEGWITQDLYQRATRGTTPTYLSEQVAADPSIPTDPARLLDVLRAATRSEARGAGTPWNAPESPR